MKKIFASIVVISCLVGSHLKAQTKVYHPFPDSNVVWNYHYSFLCLSSGNLDQYYSCTYSGDTAIKGQTYHKLTINYVQSVVLGVCSGLGKTTKGYKGAIRQDAMIKKVFIIPPADSIEQLLYDFNMQIGDTLKGFTKPLSGVETVKSIDSVLVGSNYRKRWEISSAYNVSFIEGIGSTYGLIVKDFSGTDGPDYSLTCFKQNGTTLYPAGVTSCEIINSVNDFETNSSGMTIYPNPTMDKITIELPAAVRYFICITDLLGQQVLNDTEFTGTKTEIDVSELPKGVYFIELATDKSKEVRKIIVQ